MLATETTTIASSTIATATVSAASGSVNIATAPALPPGEEIYDLMDTAKMGYPWLELFWEVAIAAIGLYLVWLFYSWLTAPVEKKRIAIVQSPETQALRAIKRLKLSKIWEDRDIKSICENVASILKNYTYDVYKIGIGSAATTDEFVPVLIDGGIKNSVIAQIKELLNHCDEIRYTGYSDDSVNQEILVDNLEKLVTMGEWRKNTVYTDKIIKNIVMVKKLDSLFNSKEWKR